MSKDASHSLVRYAALIAGWSYLAAVLSQWSGPSITVWKGLGVGLLALWAALNAKDRDGWQIAAVLAFGAAGDVVLNIVFAMGAALFAIGHALAIVFYLRHRQSSLTSGEKIAALAIAALPIGVAWLLTGQGEVVFYTLFLGLMAATAWSSQFARGQVGLGAIMFVVSDLLIFAHMGPLAGQSWVVLGVWTLYFGGQALIASGVVRHLAAARSN